MSSFQDSMNEYRKQLEKGAIQRAYQGLMDYVMGLRSYFETSILITRCLEVSIKGIWT